MVRARTEPVAVAALAAARRELVQGQDALEALHGRVLLSFVTACGASLEDGGEQAAKARQACMQASRAAEGQRVATQRAAADAREGAAVAPPASVVAAAARLALFYLTLCELDALGDGATAFGRRLPALCRVLCSALRPAVAAAPLEAGEASEVRFGMPGEGGSEGGEGWGDEEAALDAPPPPPPPHAAAPSPYELELEADALAAALEAGAQVTPSLNKLPLARTRTLARTLALALALTLTSSLTLAQALALTLALPLTLTLTAHLRLGERAAAAVPPRAACLGGRA